MMVSRSMALGALMASLVGCGGGGATVPSPTEPVGLGSVRLLPGDLSLLVGDAVQVRVAATDQSGGVVTGGKLVFASSDPTVATASAEGIVSAVAAGVATITATLTWRGTTKTAEATARVAPRSSPGAPNEVTTPGTSFQPATLTIAANDSVTWAFSGAVHNVTFTGPAPAGGSIPDQSPGARVTRVFSTAGTYGYECTRHSGMTGQVVVQGSQPAQYTSLALTPATPAIAVGSTVQLIATPQDQNGSPMTGLPTPAYTTSASSVATVNATGLVTGVAAGPATITATLTAGGVTHSATAAVTVTAAQGGSGTVTTPNNSFSPATVTIPAGGTVTWQFSGAVHNVTFLGPQPTNGNIPDQQPGNAVSRTFGTAGTYGYECTRHSGMTGQVVVQGSQPAQYASLTVAPGTPAIAVGGTVQLTATPLDQNGTPMTGLPAPSYSTSASNLATVSPTGLVTGVAVGTATITATLTVAGSTHTASATVTVTAVQGGGATVTTANNSFSPATVTIPTGATVTWQFSGGTHNVTFGAQAPTGGNIPDQQAGNAVSRTFDTAGTFAYQCTRHSGMTGQVVVQTGGGGGGSPGALAAVRLNLLSTVLSPGGAVQLTATGVDQSGQPVSGASPATFSSDAVAVATVDGTGLVRGVAAGNATVTASITSGGVTKTATVSVAVVGGPVVTIATPSNTFNPDDVDITPGVTVVWQFSGATHNVTFDSAAPAGGNIPDTGPGNAVARTFTVVGTYDYQCTLHKGMKGRVRVR